MSSASADSPHSAFRREVRARALEVATSQLNDLGWNEVHIASIAKAIGVSRPTLYAEFGNKDGLAEALVQQETNKFLVGITAILDADVEQPIEAIERAIAFALAEARDSVLLRSILIAGTADERNNDALLAFITIRSEPLLTAANSVVFNWFAMQSPLTPRAELFDTVDALVRLLVSHLMAPSADPLATPARFGRLTARLLPALRRD